MIYGIISKNDIPTTKMHIYLKNKTGNDGGNIPELFNDLSISESVNGLYAFAIGCVVTNNFTKKLPNRSEYPSDEVAILAFIQYLKGLATTVQLNKQCVNPLYNNLSNINRLGTSPSILNIDGDLITYHYDTSKYYSKEAADSAEDSFPYWVINTIKEIENSNEIIKQQKIKFELPYFIQNKTSDYINIYNKPNVNGKIIGTIPPTSFEPVFNIINDYYVLGSSESAFIKIDDGIEPIQHITDFDILNCDMGTLKLPSKGIVKFKVKDKKIIHGSYGISDNYKVSSKYTFKSGEIITIDVDNLFFNYGTIDKNIYIPITSDSLSVYTEPSVDTDITETETINDESKKYTIIIPALSTKSAETIIIKLSRIDGISPISDDHIITVGSFETEEEVKKIQKQIIKYTGCKSTVIEN